MNTSDSIPGFIHVSLGGVSHPPFQIEPIPQPPFDPSAGSQSSRKPLTFRSSRIVYYGPHACENCGDLICRMGREWGGSSFTYPQGPIYPNTEWNPHVCDPVNVRKQNDLKGIPNLSR